MSDMRIIFDPAVERFDLGKPRYRQLVDWLRANGIDPAQVPTIHTVRILGDGEERVIEHVVYLTKDGQRYVGPGTELAVQERRTAPLKVDPPESWGRP